tara:strand:+ start:2714 stop:3232 length:519 start_codon:yes stop_codon:yes gene_type:complete
MTSSQQKFSMFTLGNSPNNVSTPRFINMENSNSINRKILRQSFGNAVYKNKNGKNKFGLEPGKSKTTPFRVAMNAGDINGTFNKPVDSDALPKPSNQVNTNRGSLYGLSRLAGSVTTKKEGSAFSGNPKYVYDGEDYVRFKKLATINKNYRDQTFGGDDNNASFVAVNHVRH